MEFKTPKTVTVGARLSIELVDEIDDFAKELGRSRAFLVSEAVKAGMPLIRQAYKEFQENYDEKLTNALKLLSAPSAPA